MKLENFDRAKEIVDLITFNERQISRIQSSTFVAFTTANGSSQFEISVCVPDSKEPYYELATKFLGDCDCKN